MSGIDEKNEITPLELKARLDSGVPTVLIDVREPHELEIAIINPSLHIAMGDLPDKLEELAHYKDQDVVIYCRSGKRSGRCVEFLREEGFEKALNLKGGILAWSDDVDPSQTKY